MSPKSVLLLIIVVVACLAQVSSDLYAPSLPAISLDLHASVHQVQLSMALFMLGLALSQLIYGAVSEGLGRKIPLMVGLSLFLCGSIWCWLCPSIHMLITGRFMQGCGAGACLALWRTIFRDVYSGLELARYGAYFTIFITFIIPATPTIGAYLQHYFHWRANFIFLSGYAVLALLLVSLAYQETHGQHDKAKLSWSFFAKAMRQLLTSRQFVGYSLCTFLCYGAFFSWFAVGPILLIQHLGLSPVHFGWLCLVISACASAGGGYVNSQCVAKFGIATMMRWGFSLMIVAGAALLLNDWLCGLNVAGVIIPLFVFYFGATFIWPNAFAGAFTPFGHVAGYAGALFGCFQTSGAALISAILSYLPHDSILPLGLVFIIATALAWLVFENVAK